MKPASPPSDAPKQRHRFFSGKSVFLMFAVLLLSLADGILTLSLVERGAWEANPVMRFALTVSREFFLTLKYFLTAGGLVFLLAFGKKRVLGGAISLEEIAGLIILCYEGLIIYEITLWQLTQ